MSDNDFQDPTGVYWTLLGLVTFKWAKPVVRLLWCLFNNLHVIPAHCVSLALAFPLYLANPDLYWRLEETLFSYSVTFVACWAHASGYKLVESGDSLDRILRSDGMDAMLFMPNHQSTGDVPLLMGVMSSKDRSSRKVMWVMDKVFKFSNFGVISWLHDDFFILAGKDNRDSSLAELRTHLRNVFVRKDRNCLVIFPEGGFLRKRRAASSSFAKKMGLPCPENCTLPRTLALEVILDELGPKNWESKTEVDRADDKGLLNGSKVGGRSHPALATANKRGDHPNRCITKVVDVTIAYPDGKPLSVLDIISGYRKPCVTHVHYRVFDAAQIPSDVSAFREWMYNLYLEKDKMLAEYYRTGRFPYKMYNPKALPPNQLQYDDFMFLFVHLFFIALTGLYLVAGAILYTYLGGALFKMDGTSTK